MSLSIRQLDSGAPGFDRELAALIAWDDVSDASVQGIVKEVLENIRNRGDDALLEYTNRFDRRNLQSAEDFVVTSEQIHAARKQVAPEFVAALEAAAARIQDFHNRQLQTSWTYRDAAGNLLGQQVTPIARVGVYVPGGKATYPSSVLMNVIPAKVAGVEEIVMVTPAPDGELNPVVLAAASVAGVDRVLSVGGAQAVAALAYGTETISAVDKIVGPGNSFVATAKKMLYGTVGMDMIAGPSEILVICDGLTDPDWIAMDLFSQAEHDEQAQSILICPDSGFLEKVEESIQKLLPQMERADIIEASLKSRGAFIKVSDLDEAITIANRIAPEHLELSVEDAESWLPKISNAGAIFLGRYTPEALGDYCAGPNHVLPTSSTARFSSPLGVYDFQKRSSVIGCSPAGAAELTSIASRLARGEGLTAHARSAEMRKED
ncbi:MAG: histidinol dehydrogenase [Porticoccaceae bacterium]